MSRRPAGVPRLPKHVHRFADRHGHVRVYLRVPGRPLVPLPDPLAGWGEFQAAYEAALADIQNGSAPELRSRRAAPGSIDALITSYYGSAEFTTLGAETRRTYRAVLERIRLQHGSKPLTHITRQKVKEGLDRRAAKPSAANHWLRMIRLMMKFAISRELRRDDPTLGIKPIKTRSPGFRTWDEEHIATFEAKHPVGSRARLAFALGLYTGQRRGDVIRMGRQHTTSGRMRIRQAKTGAELVLPIHPELRAVLDASATGDLTFLVTSAGKGFTAAGFGNWFREMVEEAGLPDDLSFHGLRKAAARRLAEAGSTAREIMAITGHASLAEAERYTRAADQERLAKAGMKKVETAFKGPKGVDSEQ